jgi:hypothetical protein
MRSLPAAPGARPAGRSSPGPSAGGGAAANPSVSWPTLARKAALLFARWSAAAADARRALAVADHVRARLGPLLTAPAENDDANNTNNNNHHHPWSACGPILSDPSSADTARLRGRVVDAHLRDVEEELRGAAASRAAMAEAAGAMGRLAAAASAGAAALSASAARALERQLAPGPGPLAVAETVQDLWRACAAENQLHEAAAARCALPAVDEEGAAAAGWAAALAVLEAEVNVDRARFEAFFDTVDQAWPS